MGEDEWDFWDEAGLSCVGYNAQIDYDALNVLKGIAAGRFNTDMAAELKLPEQYVELLQSIFCSVGWADYGTSPRGCWIHDRYATDDLVAKFESYANSRWAEDRP